MTIRNLHELIDELENRSVNISSMNLKLTLQNDPLAGYLFNLANQPQELDRVSRAVDGLIQRSGFGTVDATNAVSNLLTDRHFYGAFCELAAYEWLDRNNAAHTAQVALGSKDVLNPNGCTIDGQFMNYDAFFDIKGFGMQAYLMELFKRRLQPFAHGLTILIDGPLDVAVKDIETYAFGNIGKLKAKLFVGSTCQIRELGWSIKVVKPQRVTISEHTSNPYVFAEQNRYYPFKTSRQFTRNAPFFLVFPYSSHFNNMLASNAFDMTDIALRALARRVFIQLTADTTLLQQHDSQTSPELTVSDAAKLVSALLFINLDNDEAWLFLNPRALHKITNYHIEQIFDFTAPIHMGIDDFEHDNY